MEQKTKVQAHDGQQFFTITREFDLPVELLYKAHAEPELFEQWMSHEYGTTKAVKFDVQKHGSWKFQTIGADGNILYAASGVFHDVVPNQKITRTFEAENSPFDVQLEFLDFEKITGTTSKLTMQSVFRTVAQRDQLLKLPFTQGLGMAHDRLQNIIKKLN